MYLIQYVLFICKYVINYIHFVTEALAGSHSSLFFSDDGNILPMIFTPIVAKKRCLPARVPNVINSILQIGLMSTILDIRYDHGPSIIDPSTPICFSTGRTNTSVELPVIANTVQITAASLKFSLYDGRRCNVHSQNF